MKRAIQFLFIVSWVLFAFSAMAQTVQPPAVVSPVNLCLNSTAPALSATGTNLQWSNPERFVVGGTEQLSEINVQVNSTNRNQRTFFSTTSPNVVISSIDFTVPFLTQISNLKIGIYDINGTLIQESASINQFYLGTTKVTTTLNCKLEKAGTYSIGISGGSGTLIGETFTSVLKSDLVNLTGVSGTMRVFSNIKYVTTIAPVPSTKSAGSVDYYVTQTVNNKTSTPAKITVTITAAPAPTVVSPVTVCQGTTAAALSATGQNLRWTRSLSSSVGGTAVHTVEEALVSWGFIRNTKKTHFYTNASNVTIRSVDFYVPANSSITNVKVGIYDVSGSLIVASTNTMTATASANPVKVTADFNFTIRDEGNYSLGFSAGSGDVGRSGSATIFPVTDGSGIISITANEFASDVFNNLQFSAATESTSNPTPSTDIVGTTTYYVTQTVNGCPSQPATVIVEVKGITSIVPGVACSGSAVVLSATASSGYNLNWYDAASGGNLVRSNNTTFTTPTLTASRAYYVSATNGSCTTPRMPVQATIGGYVWKGTSSSNWNVIANWTACSSVVPQPGSDITIPETTRQLTLESDLTVRNLILQGNAKLNLGGKTLTVNSISGTGSVVGSATSTLVINGTSTSSFLRFDQANPGTSNVLKELKILNNGNSVILENPLTVQGLVTITGNSVLRSNSNLTLESTKTSNASIASLAGGGSITGNVRVQNYLSGSAIEFRNFRTLCAPVHDVTNPVKGYRVAGYKSTMLVTGAGGEANGFDASPNNGATIKYYNEPKKARENQYLYPANATTEAIPQGKGIYFYFRGNKSNVNGGKFVKLNGNYSTPEDVVMEYLGTINSGDISPALTYTNNPGEGDSNGYNLIGNPYPSIIDWNSPSITKVNVDQTIWVQKQNGLFATFKGSVGTNGGSNIILPGQGFFIKANGPNPSITFREGAKTNPSTMPARLMSTKSAGTDLSLLNFSTISAPRTSNLNVVKKVSLTLSKDEFNSDETLIVFDNSTSIQADKEDVGYMGEGILNLTTITPDEYYMAINYQPESASATEVKLYVFAAESGEYVLQLTGISALESSAIFLKDNYLNRIIDFRSQPEYRFTIDKTASASFGGNRFKVIIHPPTTLPVEFSGLQAKMIAKGIELRWSTFSERNSSYFELESSTDKKTFVPIGRTTAAGSSDQKLEYSFIDFTPFPGINYYRVKQVDINGSYMYSEIISEGFSMNGKGTEIMVYPNPASDKINISGVPADNCSVNLYSADGKKVLHQNGTSIDLSALPKGIYFIEVETLDTHKPLHKSKVSVY